jgi:hypothetical protein
MRLGMTRPRRSRRRIRAAVVLVAALGVGVSLSLTSAYASSATGARGGEGVGAISGYAVSGVGFRLGTGEAVASVGFRLTPAGARSVSVQVTTGGPWVSCVLSAGRAECALPAGTGAAALDQLSVVAY